MTIFFLAEKMSQSGLENSEESLSLFAPQKSPKNPKKA
jgi:hypothetical protein